jgi:hypothetical protein
VSLYFDKEKALLLRRVLRGKDPSTGKACNMARSYSNYQTASGRMEAKKIVDNMDGNVRTTLELSEMNFVEKLPDDTFAKP